MDRESVLFFTGSDDSFKELKDTLGKMDMEYKFAFTRDGKRIPKECVWEYDEDGYVVASFRLSMIDFTKER